MKFFRFEEVTLEPKDVKKADHEALFAETVMIPANQEQRIPHSEENRRINYCGCTCCPKNSTSDYVSLYSEE